MNTPPALRLLCNLTCDCLYVYPPPCLPLHVCMLEQKDGCTVKTTFVRDCASMQTPNQVASTEPSHIASNTSLLPTVYQSWMRSLEDKHMWCSSPFSIFRLWQRQISNHTTLLLCTLFISTIKVYGIVCSPQKGSTFQQTTVPTKGTQKN